MKEIVNEIRRVRLIEIAAAVGIMWLVCELASVCLRALGVA